MARKKLYMVLDTETAGNIPFQIAYDVGWVICDREGKIYDRQHFVVREIFTDLQIMATAYYSQKFGGYLEKIANGSVKVADFKDILLAFDETIDRWNIKTLCAYNLQFDLRAMANTCDLLFDNQNWYKAELEHLCIMCAACDVLYGKKYIQLCREHEWVTPKNRVKCSAETGYRYISGDYDFEEKHMGEDDCEIECQILSAIFNTHKKFDGTPVGFPMHKVYKREKEMSL